jgi:hypothetical protein
MDYFWANIRQVESATVDHLNEVHFEKEIPHCIIDYSQLEEISRN